MRSRIDRCERAARGVAIRGNARTCARAVRGRAGCARMARILIGAAAMLRAGRSQLLWATALILVASCAFDPDAPESQGPSQIGAADLDHDQLIAPSDDPSVPVCTSGRLRCLSRIRTDHAGRIQRFASAAAVPGMSAADLQSAYKLDVSVD